MIGNRPDIQLSNNQTFQKALGVETPMFSGANINGGQFTININFNSKWGAVWVRGDSTIYTQYWPVI